ncbi:MAG: DUF2298 domain-containing protein [Dehalococcoidia bacterium]
MSETLRWWLVLQLAGAASLPLCLAFFRRLPDRGYTFSKPFGLLLLGYTFWVLNTARILPNSPRGMIFALLLVALMSAAFAYVRREDVFEWVEEHARYIIAVEVLLFVAFVTAAWLRSQVGTISGTEQPMDLMFLNAATQADHFPPKDPWLSGHTVSYYYFGYLIVAMVGRLAGVPTEIGYNIGVAMIAALTLVAAFGIVLNLVSMRERAERAMDDARGVLRAFGGWRPPVFGLVGAGALVLMGNLAFVLHFASAYGMGGSGFYEWVNVQGLAANEPKTDWYPGDFFAFFDASRIYPLSTSDRVITEFPMFSFLLGDLHPHVMALPFVLLAIGAALALYRSPEPLDVAFWLRRPLALVATALIIGGLAFLNTWDIATMAFVIAGAVVMANLARRRIVDVELAVQAASFAVPLLVVAIVAYAPFYVSFTSQADGIAAIVSNGRVTEPGTRPFHALLYWGPLFAVVVPFVVARLAAGRERITRRAAVIAAAVPVAVLAGWLLVFWWENISGSGKLGDAGGLGSQIGDRGSGWLTALVFGVVLAAGLLALWTELMAEGDGDEREPVVFALGLASTAFLLVLGCEFFYVGDVFNSRMNTVFKLYYQAWTLLALASGFALAYLLSRWRVSFGRERAFRTVWGGLAALALAGAALYPLGGTFNRTEGLDSPGELRGLHHYGLDERNAIEWLEGQAQGQDLVIAEAVGGDYTLAGRISGATGIPAILGWGGHEDQWRGGTSAARAGRFEDVTELYQTSDMTRVREIADKYGVSYIYVGDLERSTYGAEAMAKFTALPVVFESGVVTIYRAEGGAGEEVQGPR